MQLIDIRFLALFITLLSGCQSSPKSSFKELSDLGGSWESVSVTGYNSKGGKPKIAINIGKDGFGSFRSDEPSEGIYEFDFEILVGTKKLALFVDDGRQFVYNYDFSNDELKLENISSGIVITLGKKITNRKSPGK